MKRNSTLFIITFFLLYVNQTAAQWIAQNPTLPDGYYRKIQFINENTGWISSYTSIGYNMVYKTTTGGKCWSAYYVNGFIQTTPGYLYFIDENVGWYLIWSDGELYKTTNGGSSWTFLTNTMLDAYKIFFIDENIGWIVGDEGLLKTTNGGDSWFSQASTSLNDVFFIDENNGWVAGWNVNVIGRTTNGGSSWDFGLTPINADYLSIHFVSLDIGWVVGSSGIIIKTTNGGANWFSQSSGTTEQLNSVCFLDENIGYACGNNGIIVKTTNGGTTWSLEDSNTSENLESLFLVSSQKVWSVGENGTALKNFDNNAYSGIQNGPNDLTTYRGNNGIEYSFAITGSTTGGGLWGCNPYTDDSYLPIAAVHAGFIENGEKKVVTFKILPDQGSYSSCTQNGITSASWGSYGGSFEILRSSELTSPCDQAFSISFDNSVAYELDISWGRGSGDYCIVFMKQGSSGTAAPVDLTTYSASPVFGDGSQIGSTGWYAVYKGTGTEVTVTNLQGNLSYIVHVIELNYEEGYETYNTSESPNNPYSETPLPVELISLSAIQLNDVVQLTWQTATEINNYGFEIERRIDNGELTIDNWNIIGFINGHGNSNSLKEYSFIDDISKTLSLNLNLSLNYRLKQIDTDGEFIYSDIVKVDFKTIPTEFALYQNYPNPFNPLTKIKFAIPQEAEITPKVTLRVYDMLGKEVVTLINEEKEPGIYEVEWNAVNYSTGIYFYQLKAGSFIETKRMILLK